jgi:hypothetical protein
MLYWQCRSVTKEQASYLQMKDAACYLSPHECQEGDVVALFSPKCRVISSCVLLTVCDIFKLLNSTVADLYCVLCRQVP